MNRIWSLDDEKVVDKAAIRTQCLGTHSGFARDEVFLANSGMSCCRLRTNAFLLKDRCISSRPDFACFAANRQNPG